MKKWYSESYGWKSLIVMRMQDHVLNSVEKHGDPASCALQYLSSVAPDAVSEQSIVQVPSSRQNLLLYNAMLAAIQDIIAKANHAGANPMKFVIHPEGTNAQESSVPLLLDSVLWLANQSPPAIELTLPAFCVETLIESLTNEECHGVLAFLDSRLMQFKSPILFNKSHLTLLRSCTLLLRRLSKSRDAILCGRVLLFLAKFLPLTERSGVNNLGRFHTENETPVEEVGPDDVDAEGNPIDKEFYETFWSLQKWFSNPPSVLESSNWEKVSLSLKNILEKFVKEPITVTEASPRGALLGVSSIDLPSEEMGNEGASVKFLSSARLLPLQLRDATFRRHILIQALILMHWVEKPLLKDYASKAAKDERLEDIKALQMNVYSVLEAIPENGKEFANAVRFLMQAEDAWVVWKQAGCPKAPLEVPAASIPDGHVKADVLPPFKRPRPSAECYLGIRVGTKELDRLWNLSEDNVSVLKASDRGGFKTLRGLMEPILDQMKETAEEGGDVMGATISTVNDVYTWKTLRLVSRHSLSAFTAAVRQNGDLRVAARELYPDEVPAPSNTARDEPFESDKMIVDEPKDKSENQEGRKCSRESIPDASKTLPAGPQKEGKSVKEADECNRGPRIQIGGHVESIENGSEETGNLQDSKLYDANDPKDQLTTKFETPQNDKNDN